MEEGKMASGDCYEANGNFIVSKMGENNWKKFLGDYWIFEKIKLKIL